MSDVGFELDDENDDSSNVLKELRKAYKAKEKQVKELQDQLAGFQNASRQSTIDGVLAEANVDPRVARFIPDDISDVDGIKSWLAENGELFGAPGVEAKPEVEAAARMAGVSESATPVDAGDIFAKMAGAGSEEELNEILFGNKVGPVG
jgi:hypothetical protein